MYAPLQIIAVAFATLALLSCTAAEGDTPPDPNVLAQYETVSGVDYILEFTPRSAPGMTCIFVDSYNAGGLDCFPKSR